MKTKITLSIAGLLSALVFGAGVLTASAAAPVTQPANTVMNRADMVTLQNSLNTLQELLDQLSSNLKNGKITATQYAEISGILSSAQVNLAALSGTLANVSVVSPAYVYVLPSNAAKSETQVVPKSKDETQIGESQNSQNSAPLAEVSPAANSVSQANLFSVLTPKTVTGVVLVIGLIVVVLFSLRKKTKVKAEKMAVEETDIAVL